MEKFNPLISIIVPIFNIDPYLKKCIESISNQTYRKLEIILIDDGSKDSSLQICNHFAKIDTRIRVIHKKNGGLSSARNAGLDIATGDYISFVDGDDYLHKDFVECLLLACINNKTLISMCGRTLITAQGEKTMFSNSFVQVWDSKTAITNLLTWKNIDGAVCDKLFHASLFKTRRFPLNRISEDLPITVDIILNVDSITHIGKPLYYYLQRHGSISRSKFSSTKISILESVKEVQIGVLNKFNDLKRLTDSYYFKHIIYLYGLLKLENQNEFINERIEIESIFKKNIKTILSNSYLSKFDKLKSILLLVNIYQKIFKLRKGLKI